MTTKRLKKLLMAMGLSRNQVNRMVKEVAISLRVHNIRIST